MIVEEIPAQPVQGGLGGLGFDRVPVAKQLAAQTPRASSIREAEIHESDGFLRSSTCGSGNAGDGQADVGSCELAHARCHGLGDLCADRAESCERRTRDAKVVVFKIIMIGDDSTTEVPGTA